MNLGKEERLDEYTNMFWVFLKKLFMMELGISFVLESGEENVHLSL